MKRIPVALMAAVLATSLSAELPPLTPAQTTNIHQGIARHLDPAGDLYVVANLYGLPQELGRRLGALAAALGEEEPVAATIGPRIADFLTASGLDGVVGYGLSSVPRADGLHTVKGFLARQPEAASKPLWQAFGGAPAELKGLAYLPRETVAAYVGRGDLKALRQLFQLGFQHLGGAAGNQKFAEMEVFLTNFFGFKIENLVNAVGAESFISMQLAGDKEIVLPLPGNKPVSIPAPSLLIGVQTLEAATLTGALEAAVKKSPVPLARNQLDEAGKLVEFKLPIPPEVVPVSIIYTVHNGTLLIGTTPETVRQAIEAAEKRNGLLADGDFQKLRAGLPTQVNGLDYIHPRLQDLADKLQKAVAEASGDKMQLQLQQALATTPQRQVGVTVHGSNGVAKIVTSSMGGREMVSQITLAPVMMLSAIAIPNFVKARQQALYAACINNLRMIEGAKEQWAMEHNKGGVPTDLDLQRYMPGGVMPRCPDNGTYTIGAVDTAPTCSEHGGFFNGEDEDE